jgi:hypothetical protein
MKAGLLSMMLAMACQGAAAGPVEMSDDALLKMVRERQQELKCLTPEARQVPSRFAGLCAVASLEAKEKEKQMNPHVYKFVKVFVTPAGEAAATGHECTHPPGTVLIKEKLPAASAGGKKAGTKPELFTGMLKRENGFNGEASDWEFFTVSGDATKITSRGKLNSCIECHKEFKQTDGVSRQFSERPFIKAGEGGVISLHAKDAEVFGKMLRYEPRPEKNTLGYWTEKKDWANWTFAAKKETYEVEVLQGCGKGSGGAEVEVSVGSKVLKFTVEDTGHFQNFKPRVIGRVSLESGTCGLSVRAQSKPGAAVMDLRSVTLKPVK